MKITITSTTKIVTINGTVKARIWEGETGTGILVHCFVTRIAADKDANLQDFEKELQEHEPPSAEVASAYPMRIVI